jgi:amino acid transporter
MSLMNKLLGRPLASEEDSEQRIGVLAGVPTFGLDALGSAAYGPEAALTVLIPMGAAGLAYVMPLSVIIIVLLGIVYFSYRQTIEAYPKGGGSYTVASENLGRHAGLLAAAALMLDYLLDVGVGISTGVGALVSGVPKLLPHTLALCLVILVLITLINLRGVRETGALFMAPTYLFIACLLVLIAWGCFRTVASGGHPHPVVAPPAPGAKTLGAVGIWLLIRAFAGGCTALTGVEAVSNGVMAFKDPNTRIARRTLAVISGLLAIFLAGIAYLTRVYGIVATDPGSSQYQSLLSMLAAAISGRGWFYYVTIASILVVLSLSANTAFADFPRLCRIIAEDGYLPRFFAIRGRRLVFTEGILALAVFSAIILIAFGGVTDRLIPLFAIGAFMAFTLSQAGMVAHWRRVGGRRAGLYLSVNLLGALATGITVIIVLVAKFTEGAWITVLAIPLVILLMHGVHRHYERTRTAMHVDTLHLDPLPPPLAIVPVAQWNRASEAALQFACSLTDEVRVLHVECPDEVNEQTCAHWQNEVSEAARRSKVTEPQVVALASPYRFITTPILRYVLDTEKQMPARRIAVVVPELVAVHWWQYLLHNHRSTVLKALLLMQGNRRIVVINVPWYLQ